MHKFKLCVVAAAVASAILAGCGGSDGPAPSTSSAAVNAWMTSAIIAKQAAATTDTDKEAVANQRAKALIAAMTLEQKMQQLTGAVPGIVPELPNCKGGRHVDSIAALNIPTFRITNGPVGLGQKNDCVASNIPPSMVSFGGSLIDLTAYVSGTSAKATALPSAMAAAASFDPTVAGTYGEVIGTEMANLALHEFEAPGMNMARLPILGRNFEYFGEDPFLSGTMAVNEIKSIQAKGMIGMAKHYVGNEQETNRTSIQENIDRQALRELYLLPFEMSVKDGKVASIMCAYNYVNGVSSCENKETLIDILRNDWGFSGYVQSDFFATKTTVGTMNNGMDFMMPVPQQWAPASLTSALAAGTITLAQIDKALERRFTQMFKFGIFDRPVKQTPIDFAAGGVKARDIGTKAAVLLQNDNNVLPFKGTVQNVVVIGKATQVYAQQAVAGGSMVGTAMGGGGGSSDVVPNYTVSPVEGLQNVLKSLGNTTAKVTLITVKDDNSDLAAAVAAAQGADAVIVMAGTISEEGADRATFDSTTGTTLVGSAAAGSSLDWYAAKPNTIATTISTGNLVKDSGTVAMIKAIQTAAPTKTALVLKDNAGVAMDPALLGAAGPAILEVWFPGQEDGNVVADLVFGVKNPSGKLPVTFPVTGKGFLDNLAMYDLVTKDPSPLFPGKLQGDGVTNVVTYSEGLQIGYRWYDYETKITGKCDMTGLTTNPCVAFPFGHGLSYTTFSVTSPSVAANGSKYDVKVTVKNTGAKTGSEVVQVYVSLPNIDKLPGLAQAPKRLVGFTKVELAAGASKEVTLTIDPAASNHPLSYWNTSSNLWTTPAGTYTVSVGNSSSPKNLTTVTFKK